MTPSPRSSSTSRCGGIRLTPFGHFTSNASVPVKPERPTTLRRAGSRFQEANELTANAVMTTAPLFPLELLAGSLPAANASSIAPRVIPGRQVVLELDNVATRVGSASGRTDSSASPSALRERKAIAPPISSVRTSTIAGRSVFQGSDRLGRDPSAGRWAPGTVALVGGGSPGGVSSCPAEGEVRAVAEVRPSTSKSSGLGSQTPRERRDDPALVHRNGEWAGTRCSHSRRRSSAVSVDITPYELILRSQAGAEELLRELGALVELNEAILGHCEANRPTPLYKPQEYKKRLAVHGWIPEARVPPYSPDHDGLPINERYDALKFFEWDGEEVGVALEMEDWAIYNDLLKFRRGHARGQIVAGVILQPHYATLRYCFEHMLKLNEPLVGHIPILFICPRGPGLDEPAELKKRGAEPYRFPKKSSS